jgi:hypothetical protein
LVAACKIPPVAVRHNFLIFLIVDSITGEVLAKVEGTLSSSKLLGVSDADGNMPYSPVKAGLATATFKLPGYDDQSFDAVVTNGKTNYTIKLVATVVVEAPSAPEGVVNPSAPEGEPKPDDSKKDSL